MVGAASSVLLATITASPAILVSGGLLLNGVLSVAGLRQLLRLTPRATATITAGLLALQATAFLLPLHDVPAPAPQAGVRFWPLPTGSRLAYLQLRHKGQHRQSEPVVVLHGGPGIPDLAGDARFFAPLADLGYDVYLYSQLGSGPSTRLDDPRGYGIDRDVADLEAIRAVLHAPRLVLIGHSYGATLATHYLAAHPTRVAAMVLSSPGPLDPSDHSGDRATARLTAGQRLRTYLAVAPPRALLGYGLLQVNPTAAHRYLGDAEADARNDRVLSAAAPGLHCDVRRGEPAVHGSGFYALQYPQSATAPARQDIRPTLRGLTTRVLVIKGGCDYQSWQSAIDYRHALPQTTLAYLPDAGHNTYRDQPDVVMGCIQTFLSRQPLPIKPYDAEEAPGDYQQPS